MAALITNPDLAGQLIEERKARGIDQRDEVWEGLYMMTPLANDEHQQIVTRLAAVLTETIDFTGIGEVRAGINLTSSPNNWEHDYRIPDVVAFLNKSVGVCHGVFWSGGPDFAVEVVSPDDQTREKTVFYEKIETRELLIVDRDPWQLELHRLTDGKLVLAEQSCLAEPAWITSETVPLKLRLQPGETRPTIELAHTSSDKTWQI